jgi:hypothetical protein
MQNFPPFKWASLHPRVAAWIILSVGMVGFLIFEARDVGLLLTQWIALIVATVLVAGLCVWIISWEDDNPEDAHTTAEIEAVRSAPADATQERP